jgi:hypothetical protein
LLVGDAVCEKTLPASVNINNDVTANLMAEL